MMKRLTGLAALLCVCALGACSSVSDQEKAQLRDNVAVAERYFADTTARPVDVPQANGGAVSGIAFDPALTGDDVRRYLSLNLRAWCAWSVKHGAMTADEARALLKARGIATNLKTE